MDGLTFLKHTLISRRLYFTCIFINCGVDVDARGDPFGSPLDAAKVDCFKTVQYLIENYPSDYNRLENEDRRHLHFSKSCIDINTIEFFLKLDTNVDQTDVRGWFCGLLYCISSDGGKTCPYFPRNAGVWIIASCVT